MVRFGTSGYERLSQWIVPRITFRKITVQLRCIPHKVQMNPETFCVTEFKEVTPKITHRQPLSCHKGKTFLKDPLILIMSLSSLFPAMVALQLGAMSIVFAVPIKTKSKDSNVVAVSASGKARLPPAKIVSPGVALLARENSIRSTARKQVSIRFRG